MKKVTMSVKIDAEVLNTMRNIVYFKPGMTMNEYVETAVKEAISKETEIKQRPSDLRSGMQVR